MAQPVPGGVYTVLAGVGILVLGYLIKYRQWMGLISEATSVVTPGAAAAPVTASLVGNVTLVVGVFVVLVGILELIGLAALIPEWVLLILLVGMVVFIAPRLSLVLDSK